MDVLGADTTQMMDRHNFGQTAGFAEFPGPFTRGTIFGGRLLRAVDLVGAESTRVNGLSDAGRLVGACRMGGVTRGFCHDASSSNIDIPGAVDTFALDINIRHDPLAPFSLIPSPCFPSSSPWRR